MIIAINCRSFLNRNYTGIGRYTLNLVQSLSEIDDEDEYWLYAQKKYFDFKRQIPKVSAKNFQVKVDWLGKGIDKTLQQADIYHSPSPDFINIHHAKVVVTVHDLVYKKYPQGHTPQTCETTDQQLIRIVEQAAKIICCSKNTLHDLCEYFPSAKNKVCLVYQGVDKNTFFPLLEPEKAAAEKALEKKGIKRPFILFVGTIEPRKNLQNLLLAFSELKAQRKFAGRLVVVGMKGWMIEGLEQVIEKFKLKGDVIFPGYVTDKELRYFYNLTEVFVFPSFYEGFGFPIVEAFSCGAPVVTSNISSCPEIAQDAALTIDPYNPSDIGKAIMRIIDDKALRESLRNNALKRAGEFSFIRNAQETLAVYKGV